MPHDNTTPPLQNCHLHSICEQPVSQKIHLTHFPKTNHKSKNGFTLVELSIVLVVIGLIIGGVMVGKDLIFAAEIRQQVKQIEQYSLAYNTFKLKYGCMPGDCANATSFFTSSTNGNGNGKLENTYIDDNGSLSYDADGYFDYEQAAFFQHLILSNFIQSDNSLATLGYPEPTLTHKQGQGFIAASNFNLTAPDNAALATSQQDDYFALNKWRAGLYFSLGDTSGAVPGLKNDKYGIFTPIVTYALDLKVDDGKPQTGNFRGGTIEWTATGDGGYCLSPTPPSLPVAAGLGTEYNLNETRKQCIFAWKLE